MCPPPAAGTLGAMNVIEANGLPPGIGRDSGLADRRGKLGAQHNALAERARMQFGTLGAGNPSWRGIADARRPGCDFS